MIHSLAFGSRLVALALVASSLGCAPAFSSRLVDDAHGDSPGGTPRVRSDVETRGATSSPDHASLEAARPPTSRDVRLFRPR